MRNNVKKQELQSVIECVKNGQYLYDQHSYGAWGAGFITNYRIVITNNEHSKKYNRVCYWILFSARGYGKVSLYGSTYNRSWYDKYDYYDKKVYDIVKNGELLSQYLH